MRYLFALLWISACTSGSATDGPKVVPYTPPPTSTNTLTHVTGSTGDTGTEATGDTGSQGTHTVTITECSTLPAKPKTWASVPNMPTGEEFSFDGLGNLMAVDNANELVVRVPKGGPPEVIAPFKVIEVAGVQVLPDGDLAIADEWSGVLKRMTMGGALTNIQGGLNSPNSVTIDDKGFIYSTAFDKIVRIDPVNHTTTVVADEPGRDLDGLSFSPDFVTLYFNHDDGQLVAAVDILPDGTATPVRGVADLSGGWSDLDGATVDDCGNVYVVDTGGKITRIFPDGTHEVFLKITGGVYTTSLHFGSGLGGWERDHLYVMDQYSDALIDITVGIEGKWEPQWPPLP